MGNNSKIKQTRAKVHVHCTPPLMRSIHPQNIITIGNIVLEICSRQRTGRCPPAKTPWVITEYVLSLTGM